MIALNGSINSQAVASRLNVLQSQLSDLSPAMAAIAEDVLQMAGDQFASAGAAGGTPWSPLAPSTLRRKGRVGGVLQASGALLDSLTDPESPDHVEVIDGHSVAIGTDLPYAMFQQSGAGWGYGVSLAPPGPHSGHGVPMRPLLVLTSDRQNRWVGFVMQEIMNSEL